MNKPYSFSTLPVSTASFEKLNKTCVHFDDALVLPGMGQTFMLKSVVVVETITSKLIDDDEIIVGCSAIVKVDNDSDRYLYYEPLGFSDESDDLSDTRQCYNDLTTTKGSLYVYISDRTENCHRY
jgi:hypothetical protein